MVFALAIALGTIADQSSFAASLHVAADRCDEVCVSVTQDQGQEPVIDHCDEPAAPVALGVQHKPKCLVGATSIALRMEVDSNANKINLATQQWFLASPFLLNARLQI